MYDLAIIGGGPAGVAAGVYAARKRLRTVFITESFGGQSVESLEIQNWIGTEKVPGPDLAKALEAHLRAYAGDVVDIRAGERVQKLETIAGGFKTTTTKSAYESQTVLVATGGIRRKLEVPGAERFENKGVTYCASCDGPLFAGMDTVVIGGGNAGFETAAQLLAYAKSVTLIHRSAAFTKADASTVEAVLKHPSMRAMLNTTPVEVKGDKMVESVSVKDGSGVVSDIPAAGVFVEIGMIPATDFAKDLIELDEIGRIPVDPRSQRSSLSGLWAAGDCTNGLYHQNNIAAGDAVKALEDIYLFVRANAPRD